MPEQRQLGILFDSWARAVGAMRRPALAVPIAVLLIAGALSLHDETGADAAADALVEVGASAHGAPAFANLFAPRHALPRLALPWESPPVALHDGIAKPALSQAATRPPLRLTPEQQKIAQFVAKKYRIAVGDVQHLVAYAYRAAKQFRLDPYLVLAVMSIESSFNPDARSSAGAQGLMQVLTRVHADKFAPFGGASAAFDPMANISVGSRILKEYLVREGSVEGALKSYVGAAMHEHDSGYGYKVLSERERIAAAAAGRPIPVQPLKPPAVVAQADADDSGAAASEAVPAPAGSRAIVPAALRPTGQADAPAGASHGDAAAPTPAAGPMLDAAFDMPAGFDVPMAADPLARPRPGSAVRRG